MVNIIRRLYSKITIYRITHLRYSLFLKSNKCYFKAFVINIYHFPEHAILQFFARDIDTVNFIAIDKYHLCIHSFWKFWNKINNIFWVLKKRWNLLNLCYIDIVVIQFMNYTSIQMEILKGNMPTNSSIEMYVLLLFHHSTWSENFISLMH